MIGQKFNRLTVVRHVDKTLWECHCDCGATKVVSQKHLIKGNVKSCGCYRREFRKTHGRCLDQIYKAWNQMKERCKNPNHTYYKYYGGKGIRVCARWELFENFIADMGERPTPDHTVERIDSTKDYCPENCKWATRLEQSQNLSSNRNITFQGKTMTLSAWSRETGIGMKTLQYRLDVGWPLEKALTVQSYRVRK